MPYLSQTRIPHSARVHFLLIISAVTAFFVGVLVAGCDNGGTRGDAPSEPPELVVPGAPLNLSAASGDGQVTLNWDGVRDAVSYSVYRSTSPGSASSDGALEVDITRTEYRDTGASNGVTYYYQVTAVADEEGDASNEVKVTPFSAPPSRP